MVLGLNGERCINHHADLQWRVRHVFPCFMDCCRLLPLFTMFEHIFRLFGDFFSKHMFILCYRYSQKNIDKCQLFNFTLGRAKMAVYLNRIEKAVDDNAVFMFCKNVKSLFENIY